MFLQIINKPTFGWLIRIRIHKVAVSLGAYGRDSVPVLSGLNANDYVVVGGVHLLHEQQKIHPIDRDNRPVQIASGAKP